MAKDKMGWWNPVGGHLEDGETWQEGLTREAYEESGVRIANIKVFGNVFVEQGINPISGYPPISVLPFTWSSVTTFDESWKKMETLERAVCGIEEAKNLFSMRDDNHQMEEIFSYLLSCDEFKI